MRDAIGKLLVIFKPPLCIVTSCNRCIVTLLEFSLGTRWSAWGLHFGSRACPLTIEALPSATDHRAGRSVRVRRLLELFGKIPRSIRRQRPFQTFQMLDYGSCMFLIKHTI
ncbi:hypothetical protein BMJ23_07375 [Sinorhizobium medicae]|nr:hypothetical protein BMJ23_07375 [Sinorhizobium medicae]PLU83830.1 hypothetical protein BMJ22_01680 [Sinorhizobium medicae]